MFKIRTSLFILCFAFLLLSLKATAINSSAPIVIKGILDNYSYPEFEEKVAKIWKNTEAMTRLDQSDLMFEPPIIYLAPFLFSEESPDWVIWQKNWIAEHPEIWDDWKKNNNGKPPIEEGNPFPKVFAGFEYYGSPRIQINPLLTFIPFYQNDPYGNPGDFTGLGFYSIGHELHHYALNLLKVPMNLHHCIFVSPNPKSGISLMENLASFLIENNISSSLIRFRALEPERALNPCSQLTTEDQQQAQDQLQKLLN